MRQKKENEYLKKIKELVLDVLKEEKMRIFIFGSRARGDNQHTSDVDIGFLPYGKIDEKKLTILKEKIEEINIPYKVEIVNFSKVSQSFKIEALKEVILWKD